MPIPSFPSFEVYNILYYKIGNLIPVWLAVVALGGYLLLGGRTR